MRNRISHRQCYNTQIVLFHEVATLLLKPIARSSIRFHRKHIFGEIRSVNIDYNDIEILFLCVTRKLPAITRIHPAAFMF